jgi:lipopolysaccharide export LptBFGC system permease protein LptF
MFKPYKFSIYLTKDILKNFLYIFLGMIFLIFIIDFFERGKDITTISTLYPILKMTLFRIPNFLEMALNFMLLTEIIYSIKD